MDHNVGMGRKNFGRGQSRPRGGGRQQTGDRGETEERRSSADPDTGRWGSGNSHQWPDNRNNKPRGRWEHDDRVGPDYRPQNTTDSPGVARRGRGRGRTASPQFQQKHNNHAQNRRNSADWGGGGSGGGGGVNSGGVGGVGSQKGPPHQHQPPPQRQHRTSEGSSSWGSGSHRGQVSPQVYRRSSDPWGGQGHKQGAGGPGRNMPEGAELERGKSRRPDVQVYVPRARRQQQEDGEEAGDSPGYTDLPPQGSGARPFSARRGGGGGGGVGSGGNQNVSRDVYVPRVRRVEQEVNRPQPKSNSHSHSSVPPRFQKQRALELQNRLEMQNQRTAGHDFQNQRSKPCSGQDFPTQHAGQDFQNQRTCQNFQNQGGQNFQNERGQSFQTPHTGQEFPNQDARKEYQNQHTVQNSQNQNSGSEPQNQHTGQEYQKQRTRQDYQIQSVASEFSKQKSQDFHHENWESELDNNSKHQQNRRKSMEGQSRSGSRSGSMDSRNHFNEDNVYDSVYYPDSNRSQDRITEQIFYNSEVRAATPDKFLDPQWVLQPQPGVYSRQTSGDPPDRPPSRTRRRRRSHSNSSRRSQPSPNRGPQAQRDRRQQGDAWSQDEQYQSWRRPSETRSQDEYGYGGGYPSGSNSLPRQRRRSGGYKNPDDWSPGIPCSEPNWSPVHQMNDPWGPNDSRTLGRIRRTSGNRSYDDTRSTGSPALEPPQFNQQRQNDAWNPIKKPGRGRGRIRRTSGGQNDDKFNVPQPGSRSRQTSGNWDQEPPVVMPGQIGNRWQQQKSPAQIRRSKNRQHQRSLTPSEAWSSDTENVDTESMSGSQGGGGRYPPTGNIIIEVTAGRRNVSDGQRLTNPIDQQQYFGSPQHSTYLEESVRAQANDLSSKVSSMCADLSELKHAKELSNTEIRSPKHQDSSMTTGSPTRWQNGNRRGANMEPRFVCDSTSSSTSPSHSGDTSHAPPGPPQMHHRHPPIDADDMSSDGQSSVQPESSTSPDSPDTGDSRALSSGGEQDATPESWSPGPVAYSTTEQGKEVLLLVAEGVRQVMVPEEPSVPAPTETEECLTLHTDDTNKTDSEHIQEASLHIEEIDLQVGNEERETPLDDVQTAEEVETIAEAVTAGADSEYNSPCDQLCKDGIPEAAEPMPAEDEALTMGTDAEKQIPSEQIPDVEQNPHVEVEDVGEETALETPEHGEHEVAYSNVVGEEEAVVGEEEVVVTDEDANGDLGSKHELEDDQEEDSRNMDDVPEGIPDEQNAIGNEEEDVKTSVTTGESESIEEKVSVEERESESAAPPPEEAEEEHMNWADMVDEDGADSWDCLFDATGEALDPKLLDELTIVVGKEVSVQKPQYDYYNYQPKEPDMGEYGHLLEVYDFSKDLQTRDLLMIFKEYHDRGFDIKWVDDTHAIAIFSSRIAAQSALNMRHPLIKVRPLSHASRQTRVKAQKCAEFLEPHRPRPETTASVARSLVTGALGLKSRIPREKRDAERNKLREARDKKRSAQKQKKDAWEGNFGRCAMDQ